MNGIPESGYAVYFYAAFILASIALVLEVVALIKHRRGILMGISSIFVLFYMIIWFAAFMFNKMDVATYHIGSGVAIVMLFCLHIADVISEIGRRS